MPTSIKGQSAIEYLSTYGWMLLVIAIVGGAIFTNVQNRGQTQKTTIFTSSDAQIEDFGITNNGLEMEVRASSSNQLENVNISLVNQSTGETVYSSQEKNINAADLKTISLPDVGNSDSTNTYDVQITYDTGGLTNLKAEGTVTGNFKINGGAPTSINSPTVETLSANNINSGHVTLNGNVTSTGGETPDVRFNYGTDNTSLSNTVEVGTNTGKYSKTVTGLNSSTIYYFRAEANNTAGTSTGNTQNYTTGTGIATSVVAENSLYAWYPFENNGNDETAGDSTYADTTDYTATINGATKKSTGGITDILTQETDSGRYAFDGSSDSLSKTSFPYGTQVGDQSGYTVIAWSKAGDTDDSFVVRQRPSGSQNYALQIKSGNWEAQVSDGGITGPSADTGEWTHLALSIKQGGPGEFFVNGTSQGTNSGVSDFSNSAELGIGNDEINNVGYFDGSIEDVRFYERNLSGSEIQEIYQNTKQ